MPRDLSPDTARRAAALARLCSTSCFAGCGFTLWWVYASVHPRMADIVFAAALMALLAYLGLWSASAVTPCVATARRPGQHSRAQLRHLAATSARARAAAFFLSLSAFTGATWASPAAQASISGPQATSPGERANLPSNGSTKIARIPVEPTFVPLEPTPQAPRETLSPSWRPADTTRKQSDPSRTRVSGSAKRQPHRQTTKPSTHHVVAGETVWQITQRHIAESHKRPDVAAAVRQVLAANPHVNERPDTLQVGETLNLPKVSPAAQHEGPTDTDLLTGEEQ